MSITVGASEARSHLGELLDKVEAGVDVIIARKGEPFAKLVPIRPRVRKRSLGSARGKIKVAEDFDAPLPDDILNEFYK
ncbi:type II toxin-antitoxin system Phd/YefM family antitoxin [Geotalea sp. SG265]|uniref:type II toxin-antitoxin system Phd/YefM family antitoxin n=1 Tax=Geotalea sp. SG265 TaxID=2922867 RepID=UPI001FAEF26D|nr:type II toxin-antitoxin system Phd/YefM family antitoxin [Geotalea sp. SG265]